jgi:hypothetical protein
MKKLPVARVSQVVIQDLENEVLIYDLTINKAFCLNETASIIYKACDGATTFDEVRNRHDFTDNMIFFAIDELKKENLIESGEEYNSPFKGLKRREVIKKIGFSSLIALPLVASIVAPSALNAASGAPAGGGFGTACTGNNSQGTCQPLLTCCGSICGNKQLAPSSLAFTDVASCNGPTFMNFCCTAMTSFNMGNCTSNPSICECLCIP